MKRVLFTMLVAFPATSTLASVTIENWDFEDPPLSLGAAVYSGTLPTVPGWSTTATGGADRGIWNAPNRFNMPNDYGQVAFIYDGNAFAQQLNLSVASGVDYTVSFLSGWATGQGAPTGGHAELWAGGTVANGVVTGGTMVASLDIDSVGWSGTAGQLVPLSYTWTGTAAHIGEVLTVRFSKSTSGYWSFDKVTMNAVPEPMTLATLSMGALAMNARRRRKA